MLHSFIIIQDRRGDPIGLYTIYTETGPVVMGFSDQSKLADLQRHADQMLEEEGKGNEQTIAEVDVSSADEFKRYVAQSDPGFADVAEFVLDSDPYADDILQAIREWRSDR